MMVLVAKELKPGDMLRVEPGRLVAFEPSVGYDLQALATLSGPGKGWLQSLRIR